MNSKLSGAIAGEIGAKMGASGAKSASRNYKRADTDKTKSNVGRGSMHAKKSARGQ